MPIPDQPFLRSPPFPWVATGVAAISRPGASEIFDPPALFAAIGEARVGGGFWSVDGNNPWISSEPVRAVPGEDDAIVAWIQGRGVIGPDGATVPDAVLGEAALDRLAAAAYRDPFTGATIDAMAAVAILSRWRAIFTLNRPISAAAGMAGWKRNAIAQFLWDGVASPPFVPARAVPRHGATIAYWPSRVPADFPARASAAGAAAWPVEDGFLRSNGLGAECRPPMSILVDRSGGIYFDPDRPSELETILATHQFDATLLDRARRLRLAIVRSRLGKYGIDSPSTSPQDLPSHRRVILAVGQVDDDLSVIHGGAGISGNAAFLARVRAEEPDAYVLYRPHPDVAAGLRLGRVADPVTQGLADRVVTGGSLLDLLDRVHGVHVLSSLTGFEALLREGIVTVHGSPFYAGWGLTRDLASQPARRGRSLSLDALVAGVLILAPRYRDPVTELPCEPEILVERLANAPVSRSTMVTSFRKALGATRRTLAAASGRI